MASEHVIAVLNVKTLLCMSM